MTKNNWKSVTTSGWVPAIVLFLAIVASQSAHAQTYKVLHNFTGGSDGAHPWAGLAIDRAGNLYGTAFEGGLGYGTVFKVAKKNNNWMFSPLYNFTGGEDGAAPWTRVTIGSDGSLYGTTAGGGGANSCDDSRFRGCGTVFNLQPPVTICKTVVCFWTETVLYRFTGGSGGAYPTGDLTFHQDNIYGTANGYGQDPPGIVYEMTRSGGSWNWSSLHNSTGGYSDGCCLQGGVLFDQAGNLYGAAGGGGSYGYGTLYQLKPSGAGFNENTLYNFQDGDDGGVPYDGLISDASGNLYGTTSYGGTELAGTVFMLTPNGANWLYRVLYSFTGTLRNECGPHSKLVMDHAGNLYGTTLCDGLNMQGAVFKLTPPSGGEPWTYTSLHDFTGGSDGGYPFGTLIFDASGNLFGTASKGGSNEYGVVFEITP